ncbi:MAG: AMP-binding protein [Woeseiaceae bacterium]
MKHQMFDYLRDTGSPSDPVLESGSVSRSRSELAEQVRTLASQLKAMKVSSVALYADNGIEWVLSDLACQLAELTIVPLPLFFSDEQVLHAISSSAVDAVIADRELPAALSNAEPVDIEKVPSFDHLVSSAIKVYRLNSRDKALLPSGTQKISFTSGTTGKPKGVCLSADQQVTLANSLVSVIGIEKPKHLCVLPLSTLLENLAGVYAPLIAGGTVIAPSLADVGLAGSSGLDMGKLLRCIERHQPNSLILVPEILNALTLAAGAGWQAPRSLRFVAVGGGKVSPELLANARDAGLPAYEGYGLSECSSVVSLNVPADDQIGSVGRPLPHVSVTTDDGEIVVTGSTFLGYANQPHSWGADCVHTGDIGHLGDDGFLHVEGRIKHQFITSFGRNLSPEWVESELLAAPTLQQAVVVGDDRPYCVALVYPRDPSTSDREIAGWIDNVNLTLPDYARIVEWYRLPTALNVHDGLLTENGRPKRSNIELTYQLAIGDLYEIRKEVSSL